MYAIVLPGPDEPGGSGPRARRLGLLRDANRDDPAGLRSWLRQAAEEIALLRSQQAVADRVTAADAVRGALVDHHALVEDAGRDRRDARRHRAHAVQRDALLELQQLAHLRVLALQGGRVDLPGAQLGMAAERPGVNLNALLDENLRDPLSGNAVLSGVAIAMQPLA